MPAHATSSPRRPTAAVPRAARTVAVLLTTALVVTGCGLRLETPPPAEPSPDATEQVRGRTVQDALELAAAADSVAEAGVAEPVRVVLDDVAAFSARHSEELGGTYDSGLPEPSPSASPTATPRVTDVAQLLGELVDDAARATQDADDVPDAHLARLVASVAVARDGLADRLAAATGLARPTVSPDVVTSGDAPGTVGPTPDDEAAATTPPTDAVLVQAGAAEVALAHDEAAWTYTVLAARAGDGARAALLESAARHRTASDTWARSAGVTGRPADPRRPAYALPAGIDDPAVADALPRSLEQAVADASANAVADAPAGGRAAAITSLRAAAADALARGAAPVPFPGMPELGSTPVR